MLVNMLGFGALGIVSGLMVSGGVFTALLVLGLVPRFAGKSHTADKILTYESVVVVGCVMGGVLSALPAANFVKKMEFLQEIFQTNTWNILSDIAMAGGGFFAGCFVGCVALAIAEMLDSIPIFARRIAFRQGLGVAVLAVAAGKVAGSLVYFVMRVYEVIGG